MNDLAADSDPIERPRRSLVLPVVVVLLVLAVAVAGWYGWTQWQAWSTRQQEQARQQVNALQERLDGLRRDQRAQDERIQDAAATNRILREEVLGLSQRGALLEDSVAKLADSTRQGATALRLDEAELELHLAAQRLGIAGDVVGARQAYALAADTLQGLDDPRLLNVKQALEQERGAVEKLGQGPHGTAVQRLSQITTSLAQLPQKEPAPDSTRPSWQRILSPLIDVRPSGARVAVAPAQRAAFENALQLELTLARAALERNDQPAFGDALTRAAAWLPRLWPASPQLTAAGEQLAGLARLSLKPDVPEIGSTLGQLNAMRNKAAAASPPAAAPPVITAPTAPSAAQGDTP